MNPRLFLNPLQRSVFHLEFLNFEQLINHVIKNHRSSLVSRSNFNYGLEKNILKHIIYTETMSSYANLQDTIVLWELTMSDQRCTSVHQNVYGKMQIKLWKSVTPLKKISLTQRTSAPTRIKP